MNEITLRTKSDVEYAHSGWLAASVKRLTAERNELALQLHLSRQDNVTIAEAIARASVAKTRGAQLGDALKELVQAKREMDNQVGWKQAAYSVWQTITPQQRWDAALAQAAKVLTSNGITF